MFLFSKRIFYLLSFFLIIVSTSVNGQTYQLVDQNKEWDSDIKKSYLFYKKVGAESETISLTVSLDILKFKDDSGKEYGWDTSEPIPSDWNVEILNAGLPDRLGCLNDCDWATLSTSTSKNTIDYTGDIADIYLFIKITDNSGNIIPGLDRVQVFYRFTDDFTIRNNGFNSCLSAQYFTVNEAFIDGEIVCNDYRIKVYKGTNVNNNSSSTLVYDSEDDNSYTEGSPTFNAVITEPGDYNYIITNNCGEDISGFFTVSSASSFGSKILFAGYECFDDENGGIFIKIQGAQKPITWDLILNKNGTETIVLDHTDETKYSYDSIYNDANDNSVVNEFTIKITELRTGDIVEGDYKFSFKDASDCEESVEIKVIIPLEIKVNKTLHQDNSCSGDTNGCLEFVASGGWTQPFTNNLINPINWGDPYVFTLINSSTGQELSPTGSVTFALNQAQDSIIGYKARFCGLPQGKYTLSVDENIAYDIGNRVMYKCSRPFDTEYEITEPPPLNIDSAVTDISCFGEKDGAINITVSGGTKDYTYLWTTTDGSGLDSDAEDQTGLSAGKYKVKVIDKNGCIKEEEFTIDEPDELKISHTLETDSLLCYGDETKLTVKIDQESVSPYDYKLEGTDYKDDDIFIEQTDISATSYTFDVSAGSYKVTVTDKNGCFKVIESITVFQPDELKLEGTSTNNVCYGDKNADISITVTGGTTDYTFLWTTTDGSGLDSDAEDQTDLGAGTYKVKVTDANGCIIEEEFIITQPEELKLESSSTNNLCFGDKDGEIDVTVSGGTKDYVYLWTTSDGSGLDSDAEDQTGLGAGTYKIKVTDENGCIIEEEFTITQPEELKISYTLGTDSLSCYADETTLKVIIDQESVSPYDYKLEGTNYLNQNILIEITDTSETSYTFDIDAGTYKISVTDKNNCSKIIDNIIVTQPSDSLSITGSVTNVTGFGEKDGQIDVTVSGGTKNYTYLWTTSDGSGLASDTEDQMGLGAGIYTVKVTDANGCEITKIFAITEPEEFKMIDSLTNISCSGADDGQIDLTVTGGTKDYSFLWTTSDGSGLDSLSEDQTGLAPGKYNVKVTDAEGYILEDSFDISEPNELKISSSLELDSLLCFGDSTTIKVKIMQESTPAYTFKLEGKNYNNEDILVEKTNISDTTYSFNVTAGTYKITVKDKNDCQKTTIEYTIVQPDSLSLSGNVTHVTGFGEKDGEIDITISGGSADYTYLWTTTDGSGLDPDAKDQTELSAGSYTVKVTDANGCVISRTFVVNQPEEFKLTESISNVSCNGEDDGEIDITVSGGTLDYIYLWTTSDGSGLDSASEDQSGLSPGNYKVKVTDANGYIIEDSFDISEPDSLKLGGSVTNVTGFGVSDGGVDITVTGGTKDYTYLWTTSDGSGLVSDSEDQTTLGAGTYTIKVTDANGCEVTATFEVTQPDEFILSDSTANISCYGADDGSIDISVTGGTKDYSFFWATSDGDGLDVDAEDQTGLSPGTYKVVITDANDYKISGNYTITEPDEFKLTDSISNISCYDAKDGEIDISVAGGTKDYIFSWSTEDGSGLDSAAEDQTGLGPGKYKVKVTDANGCFVLDSFNVTQPDPLQIQVETQKITCSGNNDDGEFNITVTGGTKDYTFLWTTSDGSGLDSLEEDQTGLGPGLYKIKVTDENGCIEEKTLELTFVVPPVAVEDTFYVDEGGTLDTTGVILNDYDDDGDRLRAQKDINSIVNHGIVQLFPTGRLLYTHDGSETTIDSLNYFLIDENGCLDSATVIIMINPVNDLPVSVKDTFSIYEGETLVVDVTKGLLINDFDVDGDDLTVLGPIENVNVGSVILNSNGSFSYEHDGSDTPNEVCFTYKSYDGVSGPPAGFSEETEVCIKIINRVPIDSGEIYNILEGEVITTDLTNGVLVNTQELDPQDTLSVILDIPPSDGAFVLNADGTFSYDHNCSDNPNETFFTYFVTDGEDTTQVADTAKIVIGNECPIGNDDLYGGVDEGGILNIGVFDGVLANDSDQNICDILEVKLLDPPAFGGVILNSDGSFDYSHDDSENFIDEFTYLLNDGECSQWDTVSVSIRITPVPDTPPVAIPDSYECISEGGFIQTINYDQGILFNDYDDDPGQTLSAVLVTYPLHGVLILNPNGTFIYNHDGGESTDDSFTYYAVDDTGLSSDTVSVSFCILADVNDCPVPADDIFIINEGDIIDTSMIFNDYDVEGNELIVSISNPPSIGGFTWSQDGKFRYSAPDDVPAPGPEIVTFDYILSDTEDGFVSCDSVGTVTIIINYENDCPITEDDSIIVDISQPGERIIDVLINDIDPDSEIDTTSVKIISGPTFGDAISNIDGTITYIYDNAPIYSDEIIYSISDYEGCESLGRINIYFENVRLPIYNLPNYFTPNGDDFNDYFLVKYQNILVEDLSFEVKIIDRYQRIVYLGVVKSSDRIWNGENSFTSEIAKTDFYYYEITPVEYFDTPYERVRDKIVGTLYLERDR